MTDLQKTVRRELTRIRRAMRRAEKRGFIFSEAQKERYRYNPKRVDKRQLQRLQKITGKKLRTAKETQYAGAGSYGEVISGKNGVQAEKELAQMRRMETMKAKNAPPVQTISIFDAYLSAIIYIPNKKTVRRNGIWRERNITSDKNEYKQLLEKAERSEKNILYLQANFPLVQRLIEEIQFDYDDEKLLDDLNTIKEILKGL